MRIFAVPTLLSALSPWSADTLVGMSVISTRTRRDSISQLANPKKPTRVSALRRDSSAIKAMPHSPSGERYASPNNCHSTDGDRPVSVFCERASGDNPRIG
ncbi:MAG TPA: hypothetical protein PKA82_07770 [Pyrinomonadaceae bacterium]|nr:hypothetical protein [Pyrinomonadaceae bacterium]